MESLGTEKVNYKPTAAVVVPGLCLLIVACCLTTSAQTNDATSGAASPPPNISQNVNRPSDKPVDLLRALNLSPEQQAQISAIRKENKLKRTAAVMRFQRALRQLDDAIYADDLDEAVVQEREREVASAQSEVVRVETIGQLNIRRVLTPEQLATLRNLRQQARDARRAAQAQQQQQRRAEKNDNSLPPRERFNNGDRNLPARNNNMDNLPFPTRVRPTNERPANILRSPTLSPKPRL